MGDQQNGRSEPFWNNCKRRKNTKTYIRRNQRIPRVTHITLVALGLHDGSHKLLLHSHMRHGNNLIPERAQVRHDSLPLIVSASSLGLRLAPTFRLILIRLARLEEDDVKNHALVGDDGEYDPIHNSLGDVAGVVLSLGARVHRLVGKPAGVLKNSPLLRVVETELCAEYV